MRCRINLSDMSGLYRRVQIAVSRTVTVAIHLIFPMGGSQFAGEKSLGTSCRVDRGKEGQHAITKGVWLLNRH